MQRHFTRLSRHRYENDWAELKRAHLVHLFVWAAVRQTIVYLVVPGLHVLSVLEHKTPPRPVGDVRLQEIPGAPTIRKPGVRVPPVGAHPLAVQVPIRTVLCSRAIEERRAVVPVERLLVCHAHICTDQYEIPHAGLTVDIPFDAFCCVEMIESADICSHFIEILRHFVPVDGWGQHGPRLRFSGKVTCNHDNGIPAYRDGGEDG